MTHSNVVLTILQLVALHHSPSGKVSAGRTFAAAKVRAQELAMILDDIRIGVIKIQDAPEVIA